LLEVDDLSFRYHGRKRPALRHVSFRLARGESLLILGPSGCGKSTLALCLNGAIPHFVEGELAGRVVVDRRPTRQTSMAELARRVGIVFQDPEAQFCMLTVEDEVAFGLENLAIPRAEMEPRIAEALAWVGLLERRRERIERLSGGQKQRLALACVLAQRPEVLVFDEPTAQLDPVGASEVIDLLGRLRAGGQHTLVIIEHRLDPLMPLIDRTLVLSQDGEVVANGLPRQVMRSWGGSLAEAGVWVPQVSELATQLEADGVRLEPFPLTVAEATRALAPFRERLTLAAERAPPSAGAPHGTPLVDVTRLSYAYPGASQPVLQDVSLMIWPGELTAVAGANGAGKSTLARACVGILRPPPGSVRVAGQDASAVRPQDTARRVGYVFQYPEHQFVGRSLLEDVALGPRRAGLSEAEANRLAMAMLEQFGLAHLAAAHPYSLSHGEQRRLSVASMLVLGQAGLFLDEPTFGQDRRNAYRLLDQLDGLAAGGKAIVAITHDMRLVAEAAGRVLVMLDGRLRFDGTPQDLFTDRELLERARLSPPPLWELSHSLELPAPLVRTRDVLERLRHSVLVSR
jgi:energy-coupling factor transport system ATP-binding protein